MYELVLKPGKHLSKVKKKTILDIFFVAYWVQF